MVGLVMSWVMYGFNGHYQKPDGLVIENYTRSGGIDKHVKSIVNPRAVKTFYNSHSACFILKKCSVNENGKSLEGGVYNDISSASANKIRINHYVTKSYEEFLERAKKGVALGDIPRGVCEYQEDYLSEQEDFVMEKYVPLLKEKLTADFVCS
jgi:hypothetical protein